MWWYFLMQNLLTRRFAKNLLKYEKKAKNMWAISQHFQSMIWKQKKTQIYFVGIKTFRNSQKTAKFTQQT